MENKKNNKVEVREHWQYYAWGKKLETPILKKSHTRKRIDYEKENCRR